MKCNKLNAALLFTSAALFAASAQASSFSLGASVIYNKSLYKGGQERYLPLPLISYEGDHFYLHNLQAGYYLWNDPQNKLSLTVLASPDQFRPGDSDDSQMNRLDKRRLTMMAGGAYTHLAQWGVISTLLAADVLNKSNGFMADLSYLYPVQLGAVTVSPGVGVTWNSEKQNRYYYGVSSNESARSGLSAYSPGDSWTPYAQVSAAYQISESWNATAAARYTRPASDIKDSPMVDKDSQITVWGGLSYTF